MNPVSTLTETVWAPAVLAGLFSMPLTVGVHWNWSRHASLPVFLVGVVVGYYYRHRSKRGIRVGTRMGLIGALPVVWLYPLFDALTTIELSQPVWSVAVQAGPVVVFVLVTTGISTLMGFTGTLAGIKTRQQSSATASSSK